MHSYRGYFGCLNRFSLSILFKQKQNRKSNIMYNVMTIQIDCQLFCKMEIVFYALTQVYLIVLIFTFLSMVKHIILNHITAINYRCVYLHKKKIELRKLSSHAFLLCAFFCVVFFCLYTCTFRFKRTHKHVRFNPFF